MGWSPKQRLTLSTARSAAGQSPQYGVFPRILLHSQTLSSLRPASRYLKLFPTGQAGSRVAVSMPSGLVSKELKSRRNHLGGKEKEVSQGVDLPSPMRWIPCLALSGSGLSAPDTARG